MFLSVAQIFYLSSYHIAHEESHFILTCQSPVVPLPFNMHLLCIWRTERLYGFLMILRINSDWYPEQCSAVIIVMVKVLCFL
jgi:hypothetical protein